jgi:hypothetical protein
MTSEDFDQLLVALMGREKFHPFTVELAGGNQFEVDQPSAMVVRDGVAVYLKPGGIPVWFDHESVTQIVGDIADRSA